MLLHLLLLLSFITYICGAGIQDLRSLTNGIHRNFIWENQQDGSFVLYFEAGGHKSFSFDNWRGVPISLTAVPSINAHMLTSLDQTDTVVIYESTFQSDFEDIIVLFGYSDTKLVCQRNQETTASSIDITVRNDQFILLQHTNCEEDLFTPQDYFILQQTRRLGQTV